MNKRFKDDFKRSRSYMANDLFKRMIDKTHRGRPISIFMIHNWFYGKTDYEFLDIAFGDMLNEVDPGSLENAFDPSEDLVHA